MTPYLAIKYLVDSGDLSADASSAAVGARS
jgi:hypothetical protein